MTLTNQISALMKETAYGVKGHAHARIHGQASGAGARLI